MGRAARSESKPKLTPYERRLFVFLSVATFFEGYDFLALAQILPNLRRDMNLSEAWAGWLLAAVNLGTVAAYLLIRRADRWGRKRTLTITIAGYTIFTFLTGFSPNVWVFALLQLLARIFLIAEWAVSMVIAAEEFPAARRASMIGVIQGCSTLGSIVCAGLVPLLLQTEYGWRSVYFVGIVPLAILAYARRGLKETRRFSEQVERSDSQGVAPGARAEDFFRVWKGPYRGRMLRLALVWFCSYIASANAVSFWKEFAVHDRGFSDVEVSKAITIAAVASMPFVFLAGALIDKLGRKVGAGIIFSIASLGTFGSYTLHGAVPLTIGLTLGIFGAAAFLPLLNSYASELFPTELRGNAFAWSNNLLGRIGYVVSPIAIGLAVEEIGAFGPVLAATAIFPLLSIVLVATLLPETKGKELEETIRLR
ncbi:MAG: MFS transporter [Myxococcales bacterium]|nr:MFS transporter [Myxococcales bacterium]